MTISDKINLNIGNEGIAICSSDSYEVVLINEQFLHFFNKVEYRDIFEFLNVSNPEKIKNGLSKRGRFRFEVLSTSEVMAACTVEINVCFKVIDSINYVIFSATDASYKDQLGSLIKTIQSSLDIKNKELQKVVRKTEEQSNFLNSILDSIQDFVFVFDMKDRFIFFNSRVEVFLGYKKENFVSMSLREVKDHLLQNSDDSVTENVLDELYCKSADGALHPVLFSENSVNDSNNLSIGKILVLQDISDLKTKEDIINNQREQAIQSSKLASLGEMAGGVAHEINNPLAIIIASVKMLQKARKKGKLTDEFLESIENDIESTVMRITKIVSGLRTVSRDSSILNKEFVVLRSIFDDVLGLCSEKFKNNGVRLDINLEDPVFSRSIFVDRIQLSQVLINILGNAYDAVEELPEKWVQIIVHENNENFVINVIDAGKGISIDIQDKIFAPFFTSKDIGKGTGLGLSISKAIIEKNGGELSIDKNNKNTCFAICLPKTENL